MKGLWEKKCNISCDFLCHNHILYKNYIFQQSFFDLQERKPEMKLQNFLGKRQDSAGCREAAPSGRRHSLRGVGSMDYYASQSPLRKWNDSYKVTAAGTALLLCLVLNRIEISAAVLLSMGIVNVWASQVPLRDYIGFLKIPIAFLALGSVAIACGVSSQPAGDYWISLHGCYLYLSNEGIRQAMELFFKAMGAVSAMYFLALSTSAGELAGVLRKAHVPKIIVELMNMIYRFIFILTKVQRNMKTAAMSRLGYVDFKTSCRSFGQTGGNLFLLSLRKADTYYDAMVSRGYEGEFLFWEEEKPVKFWQAGILAMYALGLLFLFFLVK